MNQKKSPLSTNVQKKTKTSFLVPLGKSLACVLSFGLIVRFSRPLGILLSKPIAAACISFGSIAFVFRKYGKYSWKKSIAGASVVVLLGGGLFVTKVATPESASSSLTSEKEESLLSEAVWLIEAECGSPIRANINCGNDGKTATKNDPNMLSKNDQGEWTFKREIPVSNLYVNGSLYKGTAEIQLKYTGGILPQWMLDTVHINVKASSETTIRKQIYPPKIII
jgi:hypothetical protein